VIPAAGRALVAFDTGARQHGDRRAGARVHGGKQNFDRGGSIAAKAASESGAARRIAGDAYYRRKPPKSAGREQYGAEFVARMKRPGCRCET
jgi:anhydro-N-acetylmuramic acid kinase